MAKRFEDAVRLGAGSRIHFRKAGPVPGLGFKGGSAAIGKNETFLNVDVLGTGLSSRAVVSRLAMDGLAAGLVSEPSSEAQAAAEALRAWSSDGQSLELTVEVSVTGRTVFRRPDTDEAITDPALIQGIKQLPQVKAALLVLKHEQERVWDEVCMEMVDMGRELVDIYRLTPPVVPADSFDAADETVFAHRVINAEDHTREHELELFLQGGSPQERVVSWLSDLTLPVGLTAQVACFGGLACIDIDLPTIDDLPKTAVKKLPHGEVKIVEKTAAQARQDYATCVLGLAFFVAANVCNLNKGIHLVLVSGFGALDPAAEAPECAYSILFPRTQLENLRVADPLRALGGCTHRVKLSADFTFAPVEPCDPADFAQD